MDEIIFLVEEAPEGGFVARALGASIVTEADDAEALHEQVHDAVRCHFEESQAPRLIRLRMDQSSSAKREVSGRPACRYVRMREVRRLLASARL